MDKNCRICYWKGSEGCLNPLKNLGDCPLKINREWLDILINLGYSKDQFIEIKPNLWAWKEI